MPSPNKLFLPVLLLSYILTLLSGVAYSCLMGPVRVDVDYYLAPRTLLGMILVMPFLETVVLQWVVIEAILASGRKILPHSERTVLAAGAVVSAALFAWVHFELNGRFNGAVFGIKGGVLYAVFYAVSRSSGCSRAFVWVWLLHAASNALLMLSLWFFSRVIP